MLVHGHGRGHVSGCFGITPGELTNVVTLRFRHRGRFAHVGAGEAVIGLDVGDVDGLDNGPQLGEVTGGAMRSLAVGTVDELRLLHLALLLGLPAAGVEAAALGWVRRRRHIPDEHDLLALATQSGIGDGHGGEQGLRIGMGRVFVDLVLGSQLSHLAEIHDPDPVRDVPDDGQVVSDEDVGQSEFVLQLLHQVDHLGLHRHVEGGDGLVTDENLGVERNASGDADALALTTGELVGVAIDVLGVETDEVEQLLHPLPTPTLGDDFAVDLEGLPDDVADRHPRVERGVGVLEDDLDVAAQLAHVAGGRLLHLQPLEDHLASGGFLQAHDQSSQGRLPTTGLADDAEGLALVQLERDTVDGLHVPGGAAHDARLDRVVLDQVLRLENDLRHR